MAPTRRTQHDAQDGQTKYTHITVDQGNEPADDEELIEIGSPEAAQPVSQKAEAVPESPTETSEGGKHVSGAKKLAKKIDEEEPDYSLDDIPPMSVAQKIVIFCVIVLLVLAGWWIFKYYFGIS